MHSVGTRASGTRMRLQKEQTVKGPSMERVVVSSWPANIDGVVSVVERLGVRASTAEEDTVDSKVDDAAPTPGVDMLSAELAVSKSLANSSSLSSGSETDFRFKYPTPIPWCGRSQTILLVQTTPSTPPSPRSLATRISIFLSYSGESQNHLYRMGFPDLSTRRRM